MNIHYVLWVAIAATVAAFVYGMYNYAVSTAMHFHVDELKSALLSLIEVGPWEEKEAFIAVPSGVVIDIYHYSDGVYINRDGKSISTCGEIYETTVEWPYFSIKTTLRLTLNGTVYASVTIINAGPPAEVDIGAGLAKLGSRVLFGEDYLGDIEKFGGRPPHYEDIYLSRGGKIEVNFTFRPPRRDAQLVVVLWRSTGRGWDHGRDHGYVLAWATSSLAPQTCIVITRPDGAIYIPVDRPVDAAVSRILPGTYQIIAKSTGCDQGKENCLVKVFVTITQKH